MDGTHQNNCLNKNEFPCDNDVNLGIVLFFGKMERSKIRLKGINKKIGFDRDRDWTKVIDVSTNRRFFVGCC
jgi:hypothetical protein